MDTQNILKQLKTLEPDKGYTLRSRTEVLLSSRPELTKKQSGMLRIFGEVFQSVSAIALTSVAIIVIFGGFSVWRLVKPGLLALDPAGLRAEAQAIDIQIQLAGIEYQESTAAQAGVVSNGRTSIVVSSSKSEPGAEEAPSSTFVSVDEALKALTE